MKGPEFSVLGGMVLGSSGSSFLDRQGKIIGPISTLSQNSSFASTLSNSWYLGYDEDGNRIPDLQSFLDPSNTWISNIPGGYLRDLIPNEVVDFDLEVDSDGFERLIDLPSERFFRFQGGTDTEDLLGHGVLPEDPLEASSPNSSIHLVLSAENGDILYDAKYDQNSSTDKVFNGEQTLDWKGDLFTPKKSTRVFKNNILQNMYNVLIEGTVNLISLRGNIHENATIRLSVETNNNNGLDIRAVKLPYMMPWNAVELFDPSSFENLWRSYEYPESRGLSSEDLYLDEIKVEQQIYLYDQGCELQRPTTLQEISTGNNGGYLNLVNHNYKIDNVLASDRRCGKNKLITTLTSNRSSVNKYFGSFIDYTRSPDQQSLLYDFTNATTRVKQGTNPSSSNQIVLEHDIPFEEDLTFPDNDIINTHFRVGVADIPLAQNSIYNQDLIKYPKNEPPSLNFIDG